MLVGNGDATAPRVPLRSEMAAFDALAPLLRELLRRAPINISASECLDWQRRIGAQDTASGLIRWLVRDYPDWRIDS